MNARSWIGGLCVTLVLVGVAVWRWSASPASDGIVTMPTGKPLRIASLTLGSDEILSELVSPERLVCVTNLADDAEISNVPGVYPRRIPRMRDTDPERVIGLNPDLVCVAPYNSADFLTVMERSGLSIHRNEAVCSIDQIEGGILDLGKRVGEEENARAMVARMRRTRERLAEQLRGCGERPRVLFWSAGSTAGERTTIDDIIREAGGRNVAAEKKLQGPSEISPEQVIAADPDYILLSHWSADAREGRIENHPLLKNLRAVRENRVIAIEGRYLTSVSQFVVEGTRRLAVRLHPECFPRDSSAPAPGAP